MKQQLTQNIMNYLVDKLPNEYMNDLKFYLHYQFSECEIEKKSTEISLLNSGKTNLDYLEEYLNYMIIMGNTEKSREHYKLQITLMLNDIDLPVHKITTDHLLMHLSKCKVKRNNSNIYLNNKRICFNGFFGYLHKKKYIPENPALKIDYIKFEKKVKTPFTGREKEIIRCACNTERELAIIDLLYSTGMRVGELVKLDRTDICFDTLECIVSGKGQKQRKVYLNDQSAYHLEKYLLSRTDTNPALIVSCRSPFNRMKEHGIRELLNRIGNRAGIEKVHPHRYRRTAATNALNRGMPLQEVQSFLGHENINTTMIYCSISEDNVKLSHKKYLS